MIYILVCYERLRKIVNKHFSSLINHIKQKSKNTIEQKLYTVLHYSATLFIKLHVTLKLLQTYFNRFFFL